MYGEMYEFESGNGVKVGQPKSKDQLENSRHPKYWW